MNKFQHYLTVLLDGCAIEHRHLSIGLLKRNFGKESYQVHCSDHRCDESKLYDNPREALIRFLEIKKEVYGRS